METPARRQQRSHRPHHLAALSDLAAPSGTLRLVFGCARRRHHPFTGLGNSSWKGSQPTSSLIWE